MGIQVRKDNKVCKLEIRNKQAARIPVHSLDLVSIREPNMMPNPAERVLSTTKGYPHLLQAPREAEAEDISQPQEEDGVNIFPNRSFHERNIVPLVQ